MELDDLKQTWKQTPLNVKNADIMEIIQHKGSGPLAALKKTFTRQMRLMIIVPTLALFVIANDTSRIFTSVMFWSYIVFCLGVISFSYYNYRIVRKMENMDGMVKANLEKQINNLETLLRWNITGLRVALVFFILLTEVLPHFQHFSMLDKWHALNPVTRFTVYSAILLLQHFASRKIKQRRVGTHLSYLKKLVEQMQ